MSCGDENIRFWRLRHRHLPAAAVILNEYTRGAIFTDLAFESFVEIVSSSNTTTKTVTTKTYPQQQQQHQRRIFVSSSLGTVLQINYDTRGLECVFQLHDAPIHCISVNDGYCCTVSEDMLMRVWPLDFTDFFLEARHDGPVTALDISEDGCNIAVSSNDGTLGVMNVVTQKYRTVLRSHTGKISDLVLSGPADPDSSLHVDHVDYCHELAATVSLDGNIRVWSTVTMEEMYEFSTKDDTPTCVCFLSDTSVICGFKSGYLRVFDMNQVKLVLEGKPHLHGVVGITSSPNGRRVFSYSSDHRVCSSDPLRMGFDSVSMISLMEENEKDMKKNVSYLYESVEMQVSPDNAILAISGHGVGFGRVLLYDSLTLSPVLRLHADLLKSPFTRLRFSPRIEKNGIMKLVTTSEKGCNMVIFDLVSSTNEEEEKDKEINSESQIKLVSVVQVPCIHRNKVTALAVSQDGRYLATGGADCLIKIWDITMPGMPIPPYQSFVAHSDAIDYIVFTSNGT